MAHTLTNGTKLKAERIGGIPTVLRSVDDGKTWMQDGQYGSMPEARAFIARRVEADEADDMGRARW